MPTTRRGTLTSNDAQSSPKPTTKANGKRAAEDVASPTSKRGKTKKGNMQQMSIEESLDVANSGENGRGEVVEKNSGKDTMDQQTVENADKEKAPMAETGDNRGEAVADGEKMDTTVENEQQVIGAESEDKGVAKDTAVNEGDTGSKLENNKEQTTAKKDEKGALLAMDEGKSDGTDVKDFAHNGEEGQLVPGVSNNSTIEDEKVEVEEREAAIASSILEKGIIYFFFRSRVNVEDPQGVEDVARSYIVLRPLLIGSKLGDGPLQDDGNARLLVLPKKVLPMSRKDRFLVFVGKANATIKELKETFISASDYATKTAGTSHVPAATPVAEGVYAITSTGRESHLAYHITVPELGEIQKELGLREQGSYVISAKNPKYPAPGNAPSKMAEYPENIMNEFRDLRWMPLKPELLEYKNTQFLIIGEGMGDIDTAMQEMSKDEKNDKTDAPIKEMEKLEDEDHIRIEHLAGDDAIFADLGLSSNEYTKTQTTW